MGFRFQDTYFNLVYMPVYDRTVASIAPYRRFMEENAGRLVVQDGSSILSIGAGTGNEILYLTNRASASGYFPDLSLVAVDLSLRSLLRARRKLNGHANQLDILTMDAHRLAFRDHQFDAVMCLHTMDFVQDSVAVTLEIFRVLKKDGDFVITYPTGQGSSGLAGEIRRSIAANLRQGRLLRATSEAISTLGASVAYAPLALSNSRRKHALSQSSIERLMESLAVKEFTITEDPAYQDLVVLGKK